MKTVNYRFQLPKRAIKTNCPDCGHRYKKTLSRYIDNQTNELLPLPYGRCDRESNCGYHLSPYHKGKSGSSYADTQQQSTLPKAWFVIARQQRQAGVKRDAFIRSLIQIEGATLAQAEKVAEYVYKRHQSKPSPKPLVVEHAVGPEICTIPDDVYSLSLRGYDKNQFARLIQRHFGFAIARELLSRFHVGTSQYWPGACVFWYIDEQGRKRGGQIKVFDDAFHTVKYVNQAGEQRSKTSWVHSALLKRYQSQHEPFPDWLIMYEKYAERSPCLFGLPQLLAAPLNRPVAIVEAPKTAIICTPYFPEFTWLAVGALSYLNENRLMPIRKQPIMLFPDLSKEGSAFNRWSHLADELRLQGFSINVSDYLELRANHQQRVAGFDLADYLLEQWPGYPPQWDL